ncbi:MAG: ATP-binding cassette domain-containing protein [Candidatus Margulisiibacteriota bacterium]|jgi:lipooligosaccharide transport system ATP-binding protein
MADIVITVENVIKHYREVKAVNGLSFTIDRSECFGFLGPNGAGKTTMLKMLYGKCLRNKVTESKISVLDFDPQNQSLQIKNCSGVVPQDNNLDVELNVEQNLQVFGKLYGMTTKDTNQRIGEWLDFMELGDKRRAKIRELSGGMQRRLVIARALLNNPRLLILDEPTTGLDPQVRHLIWDKLRQLKARGVTVVLTTHYMEEAFQICDRIIIMHNGQKVLEGKPQELPQREIEKYVLEVCGKDPWQFLKDISQDALRWEKTPASEDRFMFYGNDLNQLKEISDRLPAGKYFLRQANLEDLFMKATGRELNEDQVIS